MRELRFAKELTQAALAGLLSVSHDTVSLWETEKSYPDVFSLIRLAELFNVSTELYLLGLNEYE